MRIARIGSAVLLFTIGAAHAAPIFMASNKNGLLTNIMNNAPLTFTALAMVVASVCLPMFPRIGCVLGCAASVTLEGIIVVQRLTESHPENSLQVYLWAVCPIVIAIALPFLFWKR